MMAEATLHFNMNNKWERIKFRCFNKAGDINEAENLMKLEEFIEQLIKDENERS